MPTGQKVTVEMVADVYEVFGPNEINRENGQRRIVISGNLSGRDLGGVVKEILTKPFTRNMGCRVRDRRV